jgi:UDP-N-acetylmuramate dehydrogenase
MTAAALSGTGLRGELLRDEPLARHTSWRVGGPAERLYRPADRADLVAFLAALPPEEPVFWLGLGSNLLVREGGLRGTVVAVIGRLNALRVDDGGDRVYAEAGVPSAHVARAAARAGLVGLEFLAGIPGTLGGALAMNAGAFGGETWKRVVEVETVDRRGVVRRRAPVEYAVGYREVQGPAGEWFLAATLQAEEGDAAAAQQEIRRLLERRAATQPTSQPSGGSTFRNPPGDFAARLIESAGLKGLRVGGAEVSEKHANFIVNTGSATASDIEQLMDVVRDRVERLHGVRLQTEVHIVGEAS